MLLTVTARSRTAASARRGSTASPSTSRRLMADAPAPSRASLLGLAAMSRGLRALGPFQRDLSAVVGLAWYRSRTAGERAAAAQHHRRLNPALEPGAARTLARRSHLEYARMVCDSIAAESMTPEQVAGRIH